LSGFKRSSTDSIVIDVNQAVDVNITMEVGAVSEQVEVTGAARCCSRTILRWAAWWKTKR